MKRGKELLVISGLFDILFALGLFTLVILSFVGFAYAGSLFVPFLTILTSFIPTIPLTLLEIISYGFLALLGIFGILSLVFGSLAIAKARKEEGEYYKRGAGLITAVVFETIIYSGRRKYMSETPRASK
jgi:glucan phosphoethanolaminetransferase (alkaline phosphatase superfamily)